MTAIELRNNFDIVRDKIDKKLELLNDPEHKVKLVAVSKTHPVETLIIAMDSGINIFGENYVQELKNKYDYLTQNNIAIPEFHFIGHLQRNKVKYIAPFVAMIHSVDSVRLAEEINKQAMKNERQIDILVQVNTSGEDSKSGCEPDDTLEIIKEIKNFENINIKGFMTIGSFSEDENIFRREFRVLRDLFEKVKAKFPDLGLKHLSMGMTHDFEEAIEEGATIVRVGTAIFGRRDYSI